MSVRAAAATETEAKEAPKGTVSIGKAVPGPHTGRQASGCARDRIDTHKHW